MIDLDKLEALANKLGGEQWTDDSEGYGVVFGADGDSVCVCHANAGAMPEFIYESDRSAYIAAANPAAILELIALARSSLSANAGEQPAKHGMVKVEGLDTLQPDPHEDAEPNDEEKALLDHHYPDAAPVSAAPAAAEGPTDPVVEANRKLLLERSRVGISKYGVTLAGAGLSRGELVQHALEEALDLANYLQTIIQTDAAIAAQPKDTTGGTND